ncbi:MAG: TIGR00153 family protein [Thermoplasmatales archaeon]|nr:TIGR00153 family protein [Thermoplasmatales archaeon]
MEDKRGPFRGTVTDDLREKSPFGQLVEHMEKVRECIDLLRDGLISYYAGDYKSFSNITKKISEIEHEADLIKSNIRNHLPSTIFMPVDKGKFMMALREQDKILDRAENIAFMLDMRHTKIPKKLREVFIEHAKLVIKTVGAMEDAVENTKALVETRFVKRDRGQAKEFIYKVHRLEWEADRKKIEMNRGIYKLEKKLDPMDVYHLLKIADWVDDIADHAENVVDWLRAMMAK